MEDYPWIVGSGLVAERNGHDAHGGAGAERRSRGVRGASVNILAIQNRFPILAVPVYLRQSMNVLRIR